MKKLRLNPILFLFAIIIIALSSCSKKDSSSASPQSATPVTIPTELIITVNDNLGTPVSGATVELYSSSADLATRTNAIVSKTTNASGQVIFSSNMSPIKYYWWAEKGCLNNVAGINSTSGPIVANDNNVITTMLGKTGTLQMVNNSSNPYKVYINAVEVFTMNGGSVKYFYYIPEGLPTVRVLQLTGYILYPTDETFYPGITCGNVTTQTFP